ncbi:MAG TPA: hypothetical protein VNH18_24575 [Bryobacteraceae bacterium]|nr:hypothetical protein [Bryobacteraceae bacterium]
MTPATTLPPSPPAMRRPAPQCEPFALIYAAFPQHDRLTVSAAIEQHQVGRRSVTVKSVAALIGRVPMPPEATPAPILPASELLSESANMARVAEQFAPKPDRLAENIARCMTRTGITAEEEAQYQADLNRSYTFADGHTERLIQGWGRLPSADRYERECGG